MFLGAAPVHRERERERKFTLVDADENPDEEGFEGEGATFHEVLVELWIHESYVSRDVLVQHQRHHGGHGVESRIAAE